MASENSDKRFDFKYRAARTPWSSVNNCTRNFQNEANDQRQEIKKQLKKIGLPDCDMAVNRLYNRESLKISQEQYVNLANTLNGVHLIFTNSPKNKFNQIKKSLQLSYFNDFNFKN